MTLREKLIKQEKDKNLRQRLIEQEKRTKAGPGKKKKLRDSYQPKTKVTKPDSGMDVPDLTSEIREGVEAKKALIRATPKMYPMYYERAQKGKFIKVKTKLGRTKKTKLL